MAAPYSYDQETNQRVPANCPLSMSKAALSGKTHPYRSRTRLRTGRSSLVQARYQPYPEMLRLTLHAAQPVAKVHVRRKWAQLGQPTSASQTTQLARTLRSAINRQNQVHVQAGLLGWELGVCRTRRDTSELRTQTTELVSIPPVKPLRSCPPKPCHRPCANTVLLTAVLRVIA